MLTAEAAERIEFAAQAINDLIQLLESREIKLTVSDTARKEIISMLRFYRFAVSPKGTTPQFAAAAALEFIKEVEALKAPSAITPSPDSPSL